MTTEDDRLKEAVDFHHSVNLQEARERVCEAAVEWWHGLQHRGLGASDSSYDELVEIEDELYNAASSLAELEDE